MDSWDVASCVYLTSSSLNELEDWNEEGMYLLSCDYLDGDGIVIGNDLLNALIVSGMGYKSIFNHILNTNEKKKDLPQTDCWK